VTSLHFEAEFTKFVRFLAPPFKVIRSAKLLVIKGFPPSCGIQAKIVPSFTFGMPFTGSA
jgi:hypothetical protein